MGTRHGIRTSAAAALVVIAGTASVGIGHWLWPGRAGTPALTSSTIRSSGSAADAAMVIIDTNMAYQQAAGAGTGIVLTSSGEILTNNHVINGATSITVTDLGNARTYHATVVGYDASADVAVIQLQGASDLLTAPLADSRSVAVGQTVIGVGNAGGNGAATSATGTVTAVDQAITASDALDGVSEQLSGLIETDAPIQPGDSGGPLLNGAGKVVGMDTAASTGYSLSEARATQAYTIPIDEALSVARQIASGHATTSVHIGPTPFLGVAVSGTGEPSGQSSGAMVSAVLPGGAAATAGLAPGDTILYLDGRPVTTPASLSAVMATEKPGKKVSVEWADAYGMQHSGTATLGSGPPA